MYDFFNFSPLKCEEKCRDLPKVFSLDVEKLADEQRQIESEFEHVVPSNGFIERDFLRPADPAMTSLPEPVFVKKNDRPVDEDGEIVNEAPGRLVKLVDKLRFKSGVAGTAAETKPRRNLAGRQICPLGD